MPWWLSEFSRQYYVPLIDYGSDRAGDWLLIGSGCGVMMAVMDVEPRFRWCVDLDAVKDKSRFERWACWAENFVGLVAIAGWFSYSDPAPIRRAAARMKRRPIAYTPFHDVGAVQLDSLEQFLRHLRDDVSGRREEIQPADDRHRA
jgi:hypothetical protein